MRVVPTPSNFTGTIGQYAGFTIITEDRKMIEIYQGADKKWYWRFRAGNGRIIADGSEGYSRKYNARRAFARFTDLILIRNEAEYLKRIGTGEWN